MWLSLIGKLLRFRGVSNVSIAHCQEDLINHWLSQHTWYVIFRPPGLEPNITWASDLYQFNLHITMILGVQYFLKSCLKIFFSNLDHRVFWTDTPWSLFGRLQKLALSLLFGLLHKSPPPPVGPLQKLVPFPVDSYTSKHVMMNNLWLFSACQDIRLVLD